MFLGVRKMMQCNKDFKVSELNSDFVASFVQSSLGGYSAAMI